MNMGRWSNAVTALLDASIFGYSRTRPITQKSKPLILCVPSLIFTLQFAGFFSQQSEITVNVLAPHVLYRKTRCT